jgi:hypothetical protein
MFILKINDIGCLACDDKAIQLEDEWIREMTLLQNCMGFSL